MKIHHIGYAVKSIEKSKAKFKVLGFMCDGKEIVDKLRKIKIQFLINGNLRIELIEPNDDKSPVSNLLKKNGSIPYHFCYISSNLENDIQRLIREKFVQITTIEEAPAIENKKVVFMYNKDIGIIELLSNI